MNEHGSVNGYIWHAGMFLKLYEEKKTHGGAQQMCLDDGASLPKLLTREETLKVGEMCMGIGCWTGTLLTAKKRSLLLFY